MDDAVDIPLSDDKDSTRHRPLQLYSVITFRLPSLGVLDGLPLEKPVLYEAESLLEETSPPKAYQTTYNTRYEETAASEEFYPLCLALNEKYIVVAGKTSLLVFTQIDFSSFYRLPIAETVTAMDVWQDTLAVGTQTGTVICYSLVKRTLISECTSFSFSIQKVKLVSTYSVYAIDSAGGMALVQFNVKTLLEKMIVTSVDTHQVYEVNNQRKGKLKKLWKNIIRKDEEQETPVWETLNDFALAGKEFEDYLHSGEISLAVFVRGELNVISVSPEKAQIKSKQRLLEDSAMDKVGILKFGVGGFDTSNQTHMFLVVSFGGTINYIKFVRVDDISEWHHVFTTHTEQDIFYGTFLSNNLMVLLTDRGVEMAAVGDPPQLATKIDLSNFNYIDFFNSEENTNINRQLTYKHIMRGEWKLNYFCCLEGKRIVLGNIQNWKSYLQVYRDENRWVEAIQYSMLIHQGKLKLIAGVPENREIREREMRIHFQSILLAYISFQSNQHHEEIQNTIDLSIQFMVTTHNFECLFTSAFQAFSTHSDLFFDKLEPWVQAGKIRLISNEALAAAIKHYKSQQKQEVVESLLINLDLEEMDKSVILQICLQEQLFKSLINICVVTRDYITPLIKLCSLISLECEVREEEVRAGRAIVSYIRNCLNGYYIDYHNDELYLDMLVKLVTYFMLPISLKQICKPDCANFFRLLQLFFEGKVFQLVLENSDKFTIKTNSFMEETIFDKHSCSEFQIYERMLKNIIFTEYVAVGQPQLQLDKFLLFLVLKNQFPFNDQVKTRSCEFLIRNPCIFLSAKDPSEEDQLDINAYLMRIFDSIFSKSRQPERSVQLANFTTSILTTDHGDLLCESLCYLYHMQEKFKKVFEAYLKMRNNLIREKIMLYLQENLYRPQLATETLDNLLSLMKINESKTIELVVRHLPDECETVINNLSGHPNYQLKYLESLFKGDHLLKSELKLVHLSMVIKHQKDEVENFLKTMDYPLDEAYKICEEAQFKPAMAYIAIKKGKFSEGLMILTDIFCELSEHVVKALAKKQSPDTTQLMVRLNQIIQVCSNLSKEDIQEGEELWFSCLDKIFKHIKIENLVKEKVPAPVKELLGEVVSAILTEMCKYITVEFFINKFAKTFSSLPMSVFYRAYMLMSDRLLFAVKVNNLVLSVYESDYYQQLISLNGIYNRGFVSNGTCNQCHDLQTAKEEKEKPKVVFKCTHSYHLGCLNRLQCPSCPQTQSEESQVLRNDSWVPTRKNRLKREKLEMFDEDLRAISENMLPGGGKESEFA